MPTAIITGSCNLTRHQKTSLPSFLPPTLRKACPGRPRSGHRVRDARSEMDPQADLGAMHARAMALQKREPVEARKLLEVLATAGHVDAMTALGYSLMEALPELIAQLDWRCQTALRVERVAAALASAMATGVSTRAGAMRKDAVPPAYIAPVRLSWLSWAVKLQGV